MRQLIHIVGFELTFYLRRISTYAYFGIFFGMAMLVITMVGGTFQGASLAIGGSGGNVYVNSPYVVLLLTGVFGLFGVLVTAALAGNAVYRDYETGIHPLFFTTPVSKASFLGGRFVGAVLVNLLIFLSIPLGILVSCQMPWLDRDLFGPAGLETFFHPYIVFIVPNTLLTAAIFFSLAAYTRKMLPNYVGGATLLLGYLLSSNLLEDMENESAAGLLDPFGMQPISVVTKYWTAAEKNSVLLPMEGTILHNRLLWAGVALAIFAFCYVRFRFSHQADTESRRSRRTAAPLQEEPPALRPMHLRLPMANRSFGRTARALQLVSLARRSFWSIVGNVYFIAIVAVGALFLGFSAPEAGKMYGTTTLPVTYQVLAVLSGAFALFQLILVVFYSGELVWRERDLKAHQIHDALPVPTWVPFLANTIALVAAMAALQLVILFTGIVTQAVQGYFRFEIGLYATQLFGLDMADLVLLIVLALAIHSVVNHKYIGHFAIVLFFVGMMFAGQMGIEHNLYLYGSDAGHQYSDMNGHGPYLQPWLWFKLYWGAVAVLLAWLTNLAWPRGEETAMRQRMRIARGRLSRSAVALASVALALVVSTGGFITYNTRVLNDFRTTKQARLAMAEYEKRYKRFEGVAQPRIVGVDVHVELYPSRGDIEFRGHYRMVNRTGQPLDSIHVDLPSSASVARLELDRPAEQALLDEEMGYRILRLAEPLHPGDSVRLAFDIAYLTPGFENNVASLQVVRNGSFVNSGLLPSLGYDARSELSDESVRRKFGLEPRERMRPIDDPRGLQDTYISSDADWIDFAATVGTEPDQIAIAPGYLQREWEEDGRRYFRYEMDAPILNFYSFLSARYAVERDHWSPPAGPGQAVAIEIYHHPSHTYNLDRMIRSVKASLDYYTKHFGPYQHRQLRIVEFPRYAGFAQSFPNTIPYSEAIGFIAKVEERDEDIDYPFYVTAHEVAHQWWAHQVIGGNVQGSTLMSETLSQYSALMVMEEEYGADRMKRFLKYELDRYLSGRAFERTKEMPLMLVENQGYIHYRKGSVVMYALRDYVGEERLNAAIRGYLEAVRFQGPPYTNAREFVAHVRQAVPDSLAYLVHDLFEAITLYENRATAAKATPTPDGGYEVELTVEVKKLYADSIGNETAAAGFRDLVDIGVFRDGQESDEAPLYLRKHWLTPGTHTLRVRVAELPARAGIDPYHKLIDRHLDDNVVAVTAPR